MTTDYKVTELFCIIDEFCKHFDAENAGNLLEDNSGVKRRRRAASLSDSEMCHGDWSMASPPTSQEVIDVTSTRPLSKDFDVKRFGLNTTSRIKAFVFKFVSIPAKRIRTSNANAIIHSSFFIYSIIWGKDSENLRTSQI